MLVVWAIILGVVASLLAAGYVKAPPDKAIIISGVRKKPRVLIGKAGFKIPFFERKDELTLSQVTIDVNTDSFIPTLDFINIQVDAVVKVQVDKRTSRYSSRKYERNYWYYGFEKYLQ